MTKFRPCIDLHNGRVKQIVGGSLSKDGQGLETNFESDRPAAYYADIYQKDNLQGGHVIKLGAGNDACGLPSFGRLSGWLTSGRWHQS
jgi:phosphoribosylformimino-5-aminoimidazole carboxamide ribotide isomerase